MQSATILVRTFSFSVAVLHSLRLFPLTEEGRIIRRQLVRAATSIGANVTEGQDASSKREFLQYMQIALRSARETEYWLRLASAAFFYSDAQSHHLQKECNEIVKILTAIVRTGKSMTA